MSTDMAEKGRAILESADVEKGKLSLENKSGLQEIDASVNIQLAKAYATFKQQFMGCLQNIDSLKAYCLLQSLSKMYKEEEQTQPPFLENPEGPKTPPMAIQNPHRRDSHYSIKPLTEEVCKKSLWPAIRKFFEEYRNEDKTQTLMAKLAELPLPIHLKILAIGRVLSSLRYSSNNLAIGRDYESVMDKEESKWLHYFTKYSQNLSFDQKEKLLLKFGKKLSFMEHSPGSTPEGSPDSQSSSSPGKRSTPYEKKDQ